MPAPPPTPLPPTRALRARAAKIAAVLDAHFPDPAIPLHHRDPYTLLVAVLLSAQCTDVRVNRVTPELFALAATPAAMAALDLGRIRGVIRPCGLAPQKSKAIRELSAILVRDHAGQVPGERAALERLPGVGRKTASVVLAQAFGAPAFPVDTHVHRLAARWGLSPGTNVARTERDLERLYPPARWHTLHLQMIWFGRTFCPARGHRPATCPICAWAAPEPGTSVPPRRRRRQR